MPNSTKDAIYEAFLEVLSEKPFDKITVNDISERSNVNRNTFYYYYSDIYELLEQIFSVEFTEIMAGHSNGMQWISGFNRMLKTAYSNKKIINNICASRSYDYLETYLFKSCRTIMASFVQELADGTNMTESEINFTISFYQYAVIGTLSEWFRTGMPETPLVLMKHFGWVFSGLYEQINKSKIKDNQEK